MKEFSTISREAPEMLNNIVSSVIVKIIFLSFITVCEESLAKENPECIFILEGDFFSNISTVGKTINEIINENTIPADIIHPKLIIGWICENNNEEKPAMVVMMAKKVGVALESIVSKIVRFKEAFGYLATSSSCLTIR